MCWSFVRVKTEILLRILVFLSIVSWPAGAGAECEVIPNEPASNQKAVAFRNAYQHRLNIINCHIREKREKRGRLIREFTDRVRARGQEKKGSDQALLADTHSKAIELKAITEHYLEKLDQLKPEYTHILKRYSQEIRPAIRETNAQLVQISKQGSRADLAELAQLENQLIRVQAKELGDLSTLVLIGNRLIASFLIVDQEYEQQSQKFQEFIRINFIPQAKVILEPIYAMRNMVAACEQRSSSISRKVQAILGDLQKKEALLLMLQSKKYTEKTLQQVRSSEVSAMFMKEVNELTSGLWKPCETDKIFNLPYLEEDYLRKNKLMAYADVCSMESATRPAWMHTGCEFLLLEIARCKLFLEVQLPKKIEQGLVILERTALRKNEAAFFLIREKLKRGDLLSAVREYDYLLNSANSDELSE